MKNIFKILKFEYLSCVKNKAFIITTIFLVALMLLSTALPTIIIGLMDNDEEGSNGEAPVIGLSCEVYEKELAGSELSAVYPGYEIRTVDEDKETLKSKVNDGEYSFAVLIDSELSFTYITMNNSLYGTDYETISEAVKSMYTVKELDKYGISQQDADKLMNVRITYETVTTGTDQTKNYLPVYLLMCVLFLSITSYGQFVAQSVVSEKNTRAMELLITCAKPRDLIFGKVIGSGLAGLTQLAIILLTALGSFGTLSKDIIPSEIFDYIQISSSTVILALIFFILGYFIYAFLLGALASFASKSEDLNNLTSPVVLVLTVIYVAVAIMCTGDMSGSTFMTVLSYIPFSAPMAMFVRATLSDVAVWEIAISIAVQAISVYLLGMLASAIYKIGVLMYGNPPKFVDIIKMLAKSSK
ncbi:MAG: ABC transporter permease [Clostridia bacterium]|nr:ABC transporter permease [Clostridia bacterium]